MSTCVTVNEGKWHTLDSHLSQYGPWSAPVTGSLRQRGGPNPAVPPGGDTTKRFRVKHAHFHLIQSRNNVILLLFRHCQQEAALTMFRWQRILGKANEAGCGALSWPSRHGARPHPLTPPPPPHPHCEGWAAPSAKEWCPTQTCSLTGPSHSNHPCHGVSELPSERIARAALLTPLWQHISATWTFSSDHGAIFGSPRTCQVKKKTK